MPREEAPPVDFTGTHYGPLETTLSNMMNLKVIILPDWETPDSLSSAKFEMWHQNSYGTPEQKRAATAKFQQTEEAVLGALRAKIAERDEVVAPKLTDNELRAIIATGHITLKEGNAEPEEAVIIRDPGQKFKSDTDRDPVLSFLLSTGFDNAWGDFNKQRDGLDRVDGTKLIENLDIDAEDLRIYRTVLNLRYALRHQAEFNNLEKNWYYEPYYYKFAGLAVNKNESGMYRSDSETPLPELAEKYRFEQYGVLTDAGVKDEGLREKLVLMSALSGLLYSASPPQSFFARVGDGDTVSQQEVFEIQKRLSDRLRDKVKARRPEFTKEGYKFSMDSMGKSDWRILFPIFREVYQEDKSTGAERLYLDTIWKGLQKWFPTLTNGPVPDLSNEGKEPPRELIAPASSAPAFNGNAKPEEAAKPATRAKSNPKAPAA